MPDLLDQPVPFAEAVKQLQAKKLLPTNLTTAQLKELDAAIRRQSMYSAQTTSEALLQKYKDVIGNIINPPNQPGQNLNVPYARQEITKFLGEMGYTAPAELAGTIQDLASDARINLVIKTNSELSWGAGQFVKQNTNPDRVQDFPALELYRLQDKKVPRDWQTRWMLAAQESGDTDAAKCLADNGRMVALKSSPIWDALGDGAGGYDDTLGNPYPPFAFNSGMWTMDVARADAVDLGLLDEDEEAKPAAFDFASLFSFAEAA